MENKTTRDIDLSVELDGSPEEVFRAVADGTELAKWLAPGARVTPPEGEKKGTIWISWGEGMSVEHEIEIFLGHLAVRGEVADLATSAQASWSAWQVPGVKSVKNDLKVKEKA